MSTPEGQHLLSGSALADWLAMMNERPSMQATTRERLLAREVSGRVMPAQLRDTPLSAVALPEQARGVAAEAVLLALGANEIGWPPQ